MPISAAPTDNPKQTHRAVFICGVAKPVSVVAKCSKMGTIMKAATARRSSRIANTR
jgi:hypothetical protein